MEIEELEVAPDALPGTSVTEAARSARKRDRATPADLLAERRTYLRRVWGTTPVTAASLLRHAERYGPELCDVTAAEAGFGVDALAELVEGLDRVHASRYRRDHPRGKVPPWRPGPTACDAYARALLGIAEDEA